MSQTRSSGMHIMHTVPETSCSPEFLAMLLEERAKIDAEIANGTAKFYTSAAELLADIEAEDSE